MDTSTLLYQISKDIIIPILGSLGGVISCWIAYKVYFNEYKPNIILDYEIKQDNRFDKSILGRYLSEDEREEAGIGFNKSFDDRVNIYLKIKNNSNQPITNFKLIYELKLYKHEIEEDVDDPTEFEVKGLSKIKSVKIPITLDYLPPQKEHEELIFISDIIPSVQINIIKAKCNERNFYRKPFTLINWNIVKYLDGFCDAPHARAVFGIV